MVSDISAKGLVYFRFYLELIALSDATEISQKNNFLFNECYTCNIPGSQSRGPDILKFL